MGRHEFDFETARVVDKEMSWHQRLILEARHSKIEKNTGNNYIQIPDIYDTHAQVFSFKMCV